MNAINLPLNQLFRLLSSEAQLYFVDNAEEIEPRQDQDIPLSDRLGICKKHRSRLLEVCRDESGDPDIDMYDFACVYLERSLGVYGRN